MQEPTEVLETLEASRRRLEAAWEPLEGLVAAVAGLILCFAGRHFPYSPFFCKAFARKGWPPISRAVAELRQPAASTTFAQLRRSMQGMLARLQKVSQERQVADLSQELSGLQNDLSEVAPLALAEANSLSELLGELRRIYKECLAEATAEGASLLGLPDVGDAMATRVNRLAAPQLRALLERGLLAAGLQLQLLRGDPLANRLLQGLISAMSNSLGICISCFAEARLFALSNARIGARTAVQGMCRWMQRHGHDAPGKPLQAPAEWALCFGGLYWQFLRGRSLLSLLYAVLWGSWGMSRATMLLLGLPLLLESWLQASVAANRAGLMDL